MKKFIPLLFVAIFVFGGNASAQYSVCLFNILTFIGSPAGGTWSSSAPAIAIVSDGIVQGESVGAATIFYITSGGSSAFTVTVNPFPVCRTVSGAPNVCIGSSTLYSDVGSAYGTGAWSSSNTMVATVNAGGTVFGVSSGSANITYTLTSWFTPSCGTFTATVPVTVIPIPIAGITTVCTASTTTLTDASTGGTWSSGNTAVATIGSTGVVTGVTAGTSVISYTSSTVCPATTTVTVDNSPPATPGAITPDISAMCYTDAPITFSDADPGGTWSSDYTDAATVNATSGEVTGVYPGGTADIYYTLSNACGSSSLYFPLEVDTPITDVAPIVGPSTSMLCVGGVFNFLDITGVAGSGEWESDDASVAIGSSSGRATGISEGTAEISYTVSNEGCGSSVPAVFNVTVIATPAADPITGPGSICAGTIMTYSCTPISTGTTDLSWASSNTSVATVGALTGIVTAVSPGTTTLTYNIYNLCGSYDASSLITVTALSPAITGTAIVCANATTTLSETATAGVWTATGSAVATVGSGTGVVTGVAAGIAIVTFTDPTGCRGTDMVTVNPLPAAITGTLSVCIGRTTVLSDATTGGAWTSGTTGIATVGSTGIVTGVSAGTAIISYTSAGGCSIASIVTVNSLPAAITGTVNVCAAITTTLSDATTGGAWTSSTTGIATVGSTGIVTGVSAGTSIISYTLSGGCGMASTATVNPVPAAMTGTVNICAGHTAALSDVTTGGAWTSGTTGIATVGSTGIVTGISAGTSIISYTLSDGCGKASTVTVNPLPAAIAGTVNVCAGNTSTLSDATTGGTWSSASTGIATVGSTGIVTGLSAGTSVVSYTSGSGCSMASIATVNPLPALFTVTGGGSYCAGGTGIPVGLSGSVTGVDYQLYLGATAVGTATAGTGAALPFGSETTAGAYTVVATNPATGCTAAMTGSVNVTITPVVTPSVSVTASPVMPVCAGTVVTFTPTPAAGGTTPTYVWIVDGALVSAGSAYSYTPAGGDVVAVTMTSSAACASPAAASATVTVTVSIPAVTASASAVACGGAYTLTAGGGVSYTWAPSTGLSCTGCASPVVNPLSTAIYTVTGTNALGCTGIAPVTVDGNRISGYISPTVSGTIRVWLIQFNPADSSLTAIDSVNACTASGGSPWYEFADPASGNYMVKAYLLGSTPGASGYTPTYGLSTPHWDMAATVVHTGVTDTMHINMIYGAVPAGSGFIGGYIGSGADRGTSYGVPVAGMLVYLTDAANNVITCTYTDTSGNYSFSGLANGVYIVYPEFYQYYTTPSAEVTVSGSAETITNVDFGQHTISMTITPYDDNTSVRNVLVNSTINIFPNPASQELTIQWEDETFGMADIVITDVVGSQVYKSTINMSAAPGQKQIALRGMKDGIYTITIKSGSSYYAHKIIIE